MKKKFILLLLFIVCYNINLYSQKDTLKSILSDIDIQIESTNAINKMYNYNFDEAEKEFTWLIDEYKNHPLPIFLLGLSKWWRIEAEVKQGIESEGEAKQKNKLDNQFLSLMDKSISLSKKVYEDGNKIDSVRNRLIMFPTPTPHRVIGQTDVSQRIVFNINFIKCEN